MPDNAEQSREIEKQAFEFDFIQKPENQQFLLLRESQPELYKRIVEIAWENSLFKQRDVLDTSKESETQTENNSLREQLEQKNNETIELKENLERALVDSVTGLRRREGLYTTLERELSENNELGFTEVVKKIEELPFDQLIDYLKSIKIDELLGDRHVGVMMADVSYLSYVNSKAGHEAGDEMMGTIGKAANDVGSPEKPDLPGKEDFKRPFVAFRHGGDEITAIVRGYSNKEISEQIQAYETQVSQFDNTTLSEGGLKTHIDAGVADIRDAYQLFITTIEARQKLVNDKENPNPEAELPSGPERMRKFLDIWVAAADRDSAIKKGAHRLDELKEMKRTMSPDKFSSYLPYLMKGAYLDDENEFTQLYDKTEGGEKNWETEIREHIAKKEQVVWSRGEDIKKLERKLVNEYVEQKHTQEKKTA